MLGTAIRSLAMAIMLLETLWGVLLACLCFWIAGEGSTIRSLLAIIVAVVPVTGCGFVIAVYFACLTVIRKAVIEARLGRVIFDNLFAAVLGVSDEGPLNERRTSNVPTNMSRDEVEKTLNGAAKKLLAEELPATNWARPVYWLAKRIQAVSVWATVKVIVKSCSHDGASVNLFELRDRLASTIDQGIIAYMKQFFSRFALTTISFVSSSSLLAAFGISYLPW